MNLTSKELKAIGAAIGWMADCLSQAQRRLQGIAAQGRQGCLTPSPCTRTRNNTMTNDKTTLAPQPAQAVPDERLVADYMGPWIDCDMLEFRAALAAMLAAIPQPEAQPTTNSYRKKPVVIEAIQWDGSWDSMEAIKLAFPAMEVCSSTLHPPTRTVRGWSIRTLEGSHVVSVGDYIIKGVKGEFYPCKPDIFAMTYEPAAPSAQAEQGGK